MLKDDSFIFLPWNKTWKEKLNELYKQLQKPGDFQTLNLGSRHNQGTSVRFTVDPFMKKIFHAQSLVWEPGF